MAQKRKTSCCSYQDAKTKKQKDDELNQNPSTVVDTYIPEFPDLVIHQTLLILNLHSPKLAARASLVSKQWARIWFSLPVLAFDEYEDDPEPYTDHNARRKMFMNFLQTRLKNREKDKYDLDKFGLRMKYLGGCRTIEKCLRFATERNVKELDISFIKQRIAGVRCKPFHLSPVLLNSAKSLTILKLENVKLRGDGTIISLPSLKTMSLNHLRSNLTFLQLLSGCPLVENLLLNSCVGFCGVLSSSSLKSLEVMQCKSLRVQAENLESIKLDGNEPFDITSCEKIRRLEFIRKSFSSEYFEGFNSKFPLLESLILNRCQGKYQCHISSLHLKCFVSFGSALFRTKLSMNCPNLLEAKIIVQDWIPKYGQWRHSNLITFLRSFNRSRKLSLYFSNAEALIFPEKMRSKCSPPLPTLEHLQVEISGKSTIAVTDSVLRDSLKWMAPSSEVSIHVQKVII